jgi:hypothetical protein
LSAVVSLLALSASAASAAAAQRGVAREGLLVLLLPLGARIVGAGQSVAAVDPSTEQLYWNPSAIARAKQREFAFHHGRFFVGPFNAFGLVVPFERAGVIGGSAAVLDYGTQETRDPAGNLTGQVSQQSYIFAATYAATLGPRASLGFSYKNVRFVGTCSGFCRDIAAFNVSTTTVDAGLQYRAATEDNLVFGLALRHAGLRFQVNDEPQSDPPPTRIQVGASYRLRMLEDDLPDAALRVNADVIDRARDPGDMAARFGADIVFRGLVSVRASYVAGSGEGTGSGVGIGLVLPTGTIDLAYTLGGVSGDASGGTTFFSIRGRW